MILALLEENDLAKGKREERLFELSDQMAASQWLSTQERNSLFLAGRTLLGKPEANWTAEQWPVGLEAGRCVTDFAIDLA